MGWVARCSGYPPHSPLGPDHSHRGRWLSDTVGKARWISTSRLVIGHDGDEHGHDGHTVLGGGDLGPEPRADGLPVDPVATSASRLENFHNNPDKEPDPSNRREADRDQVVHFHPGFTPSCRWLALARI